MNDLRVRAFEEMGISGQCRMVEKGVAVTWVVAAMEVVMMALTWVAVMEEGTADIARSRASLCFDSFSLRSHS
jgi:hypothetical protein